MDKQKSFLDRWLDESQELVAEAVALSQSSNIDPGYAYEFPEIDKSKWHAIDSKNIGSNLMSIVMPQPLKLY